MPKGRGSSHESPRASPEGTKKTACSCPADLELANFNEGFPEHDAKSIRLQMSHETGSLVGPERQMGMLMKHILASCCLKS